MKKKLITTFLTILMCISLTGCTKTMKLNQTADIAADKIKLTVLESEQVTIDKGDIYLGNGEYIKVKLSIENYGSETYTWTALNFSLGKEVMSLNVLTEDDVLKTDIAAGETATGYIYFPVTKEKKLTYTSSMKVSDSETVKVEKFLFKIK